MRQLIAMPSALTPAVRIGSMFGSTGSMYGGMKMRAGVRALLVDVVDDLRIPRRVQRVDRVARLDLRERVPVAVVVVARVVVVERPAGRCPPHGVPSVER